MTASTAAAFTGRDITEAEQSAAPSPQSTKRPSASARQDANARQDATTRQDVKTRQDAKARQETKKPTPAAKGQRRPPRTKRVASPRIGKGRRQALRQVDAIVEGLRIAGVERPATGPRRDGAIILVHGAGLDHRDWTFEFMQSLDPSWRVIALDRPGFGGSDRPQGLASALPASQARLLRHAADKLGVANALVVGHSWGGAVAMAWGLDAPEQTIGVVSLAGAVAPWGFSSTLRNRERMRSAALTAFGAGGVRQATHDALREAFAPDAPPAGYLEHVAPSDSDTNSATAANLYDISTLNGALALMTPRYPRLRRPVELIYGEADPILLAEEQGGAAARLLPDARLTLLPERGHMIHHTDADRCRGALDGVLAEMAS